MSRARTQGLVIFGEASGGCPPRRDSDGPGQGLLVRVLKAASVLAKFLATFSVRVPLCAHLAGIEPVGFRVTKSDLRNHQAIVQPRLYDCLMVTQIKCSLGTGLKM